MDATRGSFAQACAVSGVMVMAVVAGLGIAGCDAGSAESEMATASTAQTAPKAPAPKPAPKPKPKAAKPTTAPVPAEPAPNPEPPPAPPTPAVVAPDPPVVVPIEPPKPQLDPFDQLYQKHAESALKSELTENEWALYPPGTTACRDDSNPSEAPGSDEFETRRNETRRQSVRDKFIGALFAREYEGEYVEYDFKKRAFKVEFKPFGYKDHSGQEWPVGDGKATIKRVPDSDPDDFGAYDNFSQLTIWVEMDPDRAEFLRKQEYNDQYDPKLRVIQKLKGLHYHKSCRRLCVSFFGATDCGINSNGVGAYVETELLGYKVEIDGDVVASDVRKIPAPAGSAQVATTAASAAKPGSAPVTAAAKSAAPAPAAKPTASAPAAKPAASAPAAKAPAPAAKPAKVGALIAKPIQGLNLTNSEMRLNVGADFKVTGQWKGQAGGKGFIVPVSGTVSKTGELKASGTRGQDKVEITGRLTASGAKGLAKGSIQGKAVTSRFDAR